MGFLDANGVTRLCTKLKDKFAAISHNHAASDVTSGTFDSARLPTVPIEKGGTGATTAANAWTALGGGSIGKKDSLAASDIPDLSGTYLPLSGGALTGNVVHENANVYIDDGRIVSGTTPSANQYSKGVWIRDAQNAIIGLMNAAYYTNGRQALRLLAQRVIGGTTLYNGLMCWIDDNGNRGISVDDAAAWRSALAAAASSHTHSADDVASGTLAAARLPTITASNGGTGRTTLTSNAVLAGNGTGQVKQIATASGALYATAANGAASFGTLPVAQGGTGATSAADARTNLEITPANIGAAASSHTHSYISTSGGTATGDIKIKSTNINRDGTNPSATANGKSLVFHDNDAERVGVIRTDQSTNGAVTLLVGAFAEKSDGTEVPNWLQLMSKKDGTRSVTVSDADAWRTAISAAASSHNHSGANITSGTIDVARLPYTAARGVEISGSTIRTVDGYISDMNATKITKSSGNGTWTITQTNIEITNTGGTVYVLAFFQISINSIDIKTTNGAWYTTASDQVLAFPWTLGKAPRVVSMGTNVDRIQDIWIKKIETTKITFRPLCVQSATVTWAGEFIIISNKSA